METIVKAFHELTADELYEILRLRAAVFVAEQGCAYQDPDEKDQRALHIWLSENGAIQAYLRIVEPGVACAEALMGRVLTVRRGSGLGTVLVNEAISQAKNTLGVDRLRVISQAHAVGFYEKCGFRPISEEYIQDGIPRIDMVRAL